MLAYTFPSLGELQLSFEHDLLQISKYCMSLTSFEIDVPFSLTPQNKLPSIVLKELDEDERVNFALR